MYNNLSFLHLALSLNKRSTPQGNNSNDDDSNDRVAKSFGVLKYVIHNATLYGFLI